LLGWRRAGFTIESDATANAYKAGTSEYKNNLVHSNNLDSNYRSFSAQLTYAEFEAKAAADGNTKVANTENILTAPFNLTNPNLAPVAGGPAASGVDFAGMDAFFTPTTHKGAVGSTNWMQGWTRFPAKGQ
jgi:hypothetical protein